MMHNGPMIQSCKFLGGSAHRDALSDRSLGLLGWDIVIWGFLLDQIWGTIYPIPFGINGWLRLVPNNPLCCNLSWVLTFMSIAKEFIGELHPSLHFPVLYHVRVSDSCEMARVS